MGNWATTRALIYLIGLGASGVALFLATRGWADYDPTTGMLDLHPFDVTQTVTQAISWVGNGVAAIALFKGWRKQS